jgi:hypothetical protein
MTAYRFYVMDKEGHITAPAIIADLADDEAAKEHAARNIKSVLDIEIWEDARRVAVLKPPSLQWRDLPPAPRPSTGHQIGHVPRPRGDRQPTTFRAFFGIWNRRRAVRFIQP